MSCSSSGEKRDATREMGHVAQVFVPLLSGTITPKLTSIPVLAKSLRRHVCALLSVEEAQADMRSGTS
jgi:hypothetical protein